MQLRSLQRLHLLTTSLQHQAPACCLPRSTHRPAMRRMCNWHMAKLADTAAQMLLKCLGLHALLGRLSLQVALKLYLQQAMFIAHISLYSVLSQQLQLMSVSQAPQQQLLRPWPALTCSRQRAKPTPQGLDCKSCCHEVNKQPMPLIGDWQHQQSVPSSST